MILRTGFGPRAVFRGPVGLRPRAFGGPRPIGAFGVRRGVFGGPRRFFGGPRLASWVHRPVVGGWRGVFRPGYRPGLWGTRGYYGGRLAPWVGGGYPYGYRARYRWGTPWYGGARRRPWMLGNSLPSWLWRFLPQPPPVDVAPPPVIAPPLPPFFPPASPAIIAAPPDAGPPPADGPPPPDGSAAPDAGGAPDGGAPPADASGPPAAGGDPGAGGAPDGGAPPTGELPDRIHTDGRQVQIRWDRRTRGLHEDPPSGGGVYVVFRDGRPEAIHLTDDFRGHISRRFRDDAPESENEGEGRGESEFWRGRGRRFGGWGRRRRFARFGRIGGMRRFGRFGRIRLLRSLRQSMQPQDQDDSDDDGADDQNAPG